MLALILRLAVVSFLAGWHGAGLLFRLARRLITKRGPASLSLVGGALTGYFASLGGGFLKLGQVLSTRADLLPEPVLQSLRRLQNEVSTLSPDRVRRILVRSFRTDPGRVFETFDPRPVASASIAQVHRATLRGTGQPVAVKVRRPGVERLMAVDCWLVEAAVAVTARLPGLRRIPLREAVGEVCRVLVAQTDFVREAANLRRYRSQSDWGEVEVPRPVDHLCTAEVITMEYLDTLGRITDAWIDPRVRRAAVRQTLRSLYRAIFVHGFFHCDPHPGNVLITPRGSVALVDLGYVGEFQTGERRSFAEFFLHVALRNGPRVAAIVRQTALRVPPALDVPRFEADIAGLLATSAQRTAGQFQIVRFVGELFRVQRAHNIYGSPHFTLAILTLLTFEGTIKSVDPDIDFQGEAVPSLLAGLNRS